MPLPPGPKLPASLQTLWWIRRPIEFLRFCRARYGDTFTIEIVGSGKVVLISTPDHIKQVFTGDPELLRAGEVNSILGPIVGEQSVLLLDGARHLRHRRLMLPPFHGERMRLYATTMQEITERDLDEWPMGTPFALRPHMQRITLRVILKTVFGLDESEDLEELEKRLDRLLSIVDRPWAVLGLIPAFRKDWPLLPWRLFLRLRERADEQIYRDIARRRGAGTEGRTDVLSMLLEAVDEDGSHLDDSELRDELMTLLLAGHETTATAICWAVERILDTPRVLARIETELDSVVGSGTLGPDHLSRLEYLDATIEEVLRLRPVIPMVGRRLHAEMNIGELSVPKGWVIAPSIYLTHMNPKVYDDPEAFRPERFLEKRVDPYAWLPFGGGIRRCLGMAFALYEMKVVMATLFHRTRLELAQRAPVEMVRRSITFSPAKGTVVRQLPKPKRVAGNRQTVVTSA